MSKIREKYLQKNINNLKNMFQAKDITDTSTQGWEYFASVFGTDNNIAKYADQLYRKCDLIQSCIKEISTSIAEAKLKVYKPLKNGKEIEVKDKEYTNYFYNNEYFSYSDILQLIISRLELHGISYLIAERFKYQEGFANIVPVPTNYILRETNGYKVTYRYNNDRKKVIKNSQVVSFMYPDPDTLYGYISPLDSIYDEVQIDFDRKSLTKEVLKNKKIPGLIVSSEQTLTTKSMKQLKENINTALGASTKNRAETLVLPNGLKVQNGHDIKDIDFSVLNRLTETRICSAFQVPPILLGLASGLDSATYSNYEQAVSSFYREKIIPLWRLIEEELTRKLLKDTPYIYRFDTSEIAELQEEEDKVLQRTINKYSSGIISIEEARNELGYKGEIEVAVPSIEEAKEAKVKGYIIYNGNDLDYQKIENIEQLNDANINLPVFEEENTEEEMKKIKEQIFVNKEDK